MLPGRNDYSLRDLELIEIGLPFAKRLRAGGDAPPILGVERDNMARPFDLLDRC